MAASLGYSSMMPWSQLFGNTFTGNGARARQLALTYDDGPTEVDTLNLLEVLDRHEAKATFFMLGRNVKARPEIAQAVAAAGHAIGNHTYNHPNLVFCSPSRIREELDQCERVLTDTVGEHSPLFRPPFGARRPDVIQLVREAGLIPVMWTVTAFDWSAKSSAEIEDHVHRHVKGGEIILMHDGDFAGLADRSLTVAATGHLIRRYQDRGFSFVSIPEMMASQAQDQLDRQLRRREYGSESG
jgi:peptidoglycan/xylan/chitin deacetylase (PgdA/CDA1 family)